MLVLGSGQTAMINALVRGRAGIAGRIEVRVNVGRLTRIRRSARGDYSAVYVPPKLQYPQVALFSAVATRSGRSVFARASLPLWGRAKVLIRSHRGATIYVHVGQTRFGPVTADQKGRARVAVVIPPGVHTVKAGKRRVRVPYPRPNRLGAVADRQTLVVHPAESATLFIYAVDAAGRPDRLARMQLTADRGVVTKATRVLPGLFRAHYHTPTAVGNGRATVIVRLAGDKVSRAALTFTLLGGAARRLALRTSRNTAVAGDRTPLRLTIEAADASGNPASSAIRCRSDLARVGPVRSTLPGQYTASVEIPSFFAGKRQTLIRCVAGKGNEAVAAETTISLSPGKPVRIRLIRPKRRPTAHGRSPITMRAQILDAHRNVIPGGRLHVSATTGETRTNRRSDGGFDIVYAPPMSRLDGQTQLDVSTGANLHARTTVRLRRHPYWLSLAPQVGLISNLGNVNSPIFGAELSLGLDRLLPGLWASAEAGYYFLRASLKTPDTTALLHAAPLLLSVGYRYWVHRRVYLFAAFGAGVALTQLRTQVAAQPEDIQSAAQLALQGTLGAAYRLGPGDIVASVRYLHLSNRGLDMLHGRPGGLAAMVGYRFGIH